MTELITAIVGVLAILGALVAFVRWVRPKWREMKHDARAGRDALLGREAVYDSITGKEITPALPGIGQRVASLEETSAATAVALTRLADTHTRIDGLEHRVSRLERGDAERTLARTESIELLRTIDTVARNKKDDD